MRIPRSRVICATRRFATRPPVGLEAADSASSSKMLQQVPGKVEVLDVGGTVSFWEESEIALDERVSIVVANLVVDPTQPRTRAISAIQADARDLSMFPDARFDVVFSNSVVEHLIGFSDREAMAKEIRRVGRRYFVQTPNRYFFVEPHFGFPFFQFLPVSVRAWLLQHFALAWAGKIAERDKALRVAAVGGAPRSLRAASAVSRLFPAARAHRRGDEIADRLWGMVRQAHAGDSGHVAALQYIRLSSRDEGELLHERKSRA